MNINKRLKKIQRELAEMEFENDYRNTMIHWNKRNFQSYYEKLNRVERAASELKIFLRDLKIRDNEGGIDHTKTEKKLLKLLDKYDAERTKKLGLLMNIGHDRGIK